MTNTYKETMTTMTAPERPILFSGPMVRAILEGRKTQTRRVLKYDQLIRENWYPDRYNQTADWTFWGPRGTPQSGQCTLPLFRSRYGVPGDRLWVRETFVYRSKHDRFYYRADHAEPFTAPYAHDGWKPSIFMPRKACRIVLEVTDVRIERLQSISEEDAKAEGVWGKDEPYQGVGDLAVDRYERLWGEINGPASWASNPWVWVIEFKRVHVS